MKTFDGASCPSARLPACPPSLSPTVCKFWRAPLVQPPYYEFTSTILSDLDPEAPISLNNLQMLASRWAGPWARQGQGGGGAVSEVASGG